MVRCTVGCTYRGCTYIWWGVQWGVHTVRCMLLCTYGEVYSEVYIW